MYKTSRAPARARARGPFVAWNSYHYGPTAALFELLKTRPKKLLRPELVLRTLFDSDRFELVGECEARPCSPI